MERSGLSKTIGETKWEGVSKKSGGRGGEVKNCPTPLPAPFFSHSLSVSFPSRKFLETPATQATGSKILGS